MRTIGRESKKEATRLALAQAVLTRAKEHGIEHVTIEAVAADAGVSVRTFHNYFSGKEDALVHFANVLLGRVMDSVRTRPNTETLWQSLRFAMTEITVETDDVDPHILVALLRLFDTEPGLIAHSRRSDLECTFHNWLEELLDDRGLPSDTLYPHIAFNVAFVTARSALEFWAARCDTTTASAREAIDAAFDQAEYGMAEPLPNNSAHPHHKEI